MKDEIEKLIIEWLEEQSRRDGDIDLGDLAQIICDYCHERVLEQ